MWYLDIYQLNKDITWGRVILWFKVPFLRYLFNWYMSRYHIGKGHTLVKVPCLCSLFNCYMSRYHMGKSHALVKVPFLCSLFNWYKAQRHGTLTRVWPFSMWYLDIYHLNKEQRHGTLNQSMTLPHVISRHISVKQRTKTWHFKPEYSLFFV
jgi:hypothetical protein